MNEPPCPTPVVEELTPAPRVEQALAALADLPAVLLLESCLKRAEVGRYSFLTADPFAFFERQTAEPGADPFADLRAQCARFQAEPLAGLPPFQGGAAGLLSYELGHGWERFPFARFDEFEFPAFAVGLYDWVIAWDHERDAAWVISQGFPETEPDRRARRAAERARWVREQLSRRPEENAQRAMLPPGAAADVLRAQQWPAEGPAGLVSDFTRDAYIRAVERVIEYIRAGDVFQANLSQRLLYPLETSPLELYRRLRTENRATFAGYFAHDDWAIASASPERFLRVAGGEVETRPIKGTRRRAAGPEADLYTRDALRQSDKDQAENVMIVDLLRNDLSRVCRPGSIRVPQLCAVETFETVQHLVSEVRGELAPKHDVWDLLAASFPGGSITGAPKVRAMEILSELEPTARGPYCGSLFYAGFDGTADSNILIRTFVCRRGWIQCSVGGGIVAQSDPVAEYEETMHKAEGMLRVLGDGR